MRYLLFVALLFRCAVVGADVEIPKEEAASVKGYDLEQFDEKKHELMGKLIKIKFTSRDTEIRKAEDGSLDATFYLWRESTATRDSKSAYVYANVPATGEKWLRSIPAAKDKRSPIVMYARVFDYDGTPMVRILGREMKTDLRGSRVVW